MVGSRVVLTAAYSADESALRWVVSWGSWRVETKVDLMGHKMVT